MDLSIYYPFFCCFVCLLSFAHGGSVSSMVFYFYFYWFRARERERDQTHNLDICPVQELNRWPFCAQDNIQPRHTGQGSPGLIWMVVYYSLIGCVFVYVYINPMLPGQMRCPLRVGFMVPSQIIQRYPWAIQASTTFSVGVVPVALE